MRAQILLLCSACSASKHPLPPENQITPVKVADFPGYSEGITFDAEGSAFVSVGRNPQSRHEVYRLVPNQPPAAWLRLRIPNGHKVREDGTHLIAGEGIIVHVTRDGQILDSLAASSSGQSLRRPNDIALDGHGGFYFTDPGVRDSASRSGKVLYGDRGFRLSVVADSFCYPNGLIVQANGRGLYLADSCDNRIYRLPIHGPGKLGPRKLLATLRDSAQTGLDGMTLDDAGRLYIAHNGAARIEVLDPEGRLLRRYPAGNLLASNVAFGGPGLADLYITGSPGEKSGPGALYRIHLGIKGRSSMALPAP